MSTTLEELRQLSLQQQAKETQASASPEAATDSSEGDSQPTLPATRPDLAARVRATLTAASDEKAREIPSELAQRVQKYCLDHQVSVRQLQVVLMEHFLEDEGY